MDQARIRAYVMFHLVGRPAERAVKFSDLLTMAGLRQHRAATREELDALEAEGLVDWLAIGAGTGGRPGRAYYDAGGVRPAASRAVEDAITARLERHPRDWVRTQALRVDLGAAGHRQSSITLGIAYLVKGRAAEQGDRGNVEYLRAT